MTDLLARSLVSSAARRHARARASGPHTTLPAKPARLPELEPGCMGAITPVRAAFDRRGSRRPGPLDTPPLFAWLSRPAVPLARWPVSRLVLVSVPVERVAGDLARQARS